MPFLDSLCPCGTGLIYRECCDIFHQKISLVYPTTPEQLMRSRYSAYAKGYYEYIIATTLPIQQQWLNIKEITAWSKQHQWLALVIHQHALPPLKQPFHKQVKFTAFALVNGNEIRHTERSTFIFQNGRWYFLDPTVPPDLKKNDDCFCDHGLSYKKCCAPFFDEYIL